MKKLLVLLLVLGLTSAANAALSFQIDGSDAGSSIDLARGETVTIQVYSSDTSNYVVYAGMDISTMSAFGSVDNVVTYAAAGGNGSSDTYYEAGWMDGFELNTLTPNIAVGIQHSFDYTAPSDSDGSTRMGMFQPPNYSWDAHELDTLTINVPEPMTIALLGLGGLFLRRRKK
jgi:hypothetical protein